ncbi:O-methyltransferase [Galliscardovia ingluviei]|uniref:O-methyltransferase n=1 Tax=Galliscardovia ingluviei TaxID=1769422 RepID=A0A8J3AGB0_9BIFI|nr:class I SAM-dependent methyltransferase [Galliscardovia ingluviei]GGI12788.1 O-methyltransferase [Galliscardovia ingluviei]
MEHNDALNLAKAWEYTDRLAASAEPAGIQDVRDDAIELGFSPTSAMQAQWLGMMAHLLQAESVLLLGTGNAVETAQLLIAMDSVGMQTAAGQLTVVDSSHRGAVLVRSVPARLEQPIRTRLRVANTSAQLFVPRLNAGDYDVVVIDGDLSNYEDMLDQAHRVLRDGGVLIVADAFAQRDEQSQGGVINPADHSSKAVLMRAFTEEIVHDDRFAVHVLPIGTGIIVAAKQ